MMMSFEEMKRKIDALCAEVEKRYKTTPATASVCFQQLDDGLMNIGMEPDCVNLWQVFRRMKDAEEEWDKLTAKEQKALGELPKGKQWK